MKNKQSREQLQESIEKRLLVLRQEKASSAKVLSEMLQEKIPYSSLVIQIEEERYLSALGEELMLERERSTEKLAINYIVSPEVANLLQVTSEECAVTIVVRSNNLEGLARQTLGNFVKAAVETLNKAVAERGFNSEV